VAIDDGADSKETNAWTNSSLAVYLSLRSSDSDKYNVSRNFVFLVGLSMTACIRVNPKQIMPCGEIDVIFTTGNFRGPV
jgi:hypothetical protein